MNPRLESIFPPIDLDHEAETRAQADVDGLLTELAGVVGELERLRHEQSALTAAAGGGGHAPDGQPSGESSREPRDPGQAFVAQLLAADPDARKNAEKAADAAWNAEQRRRQAVAQSDERTRMILAALDSALIEREQRARVLRDDLDRALSMLNMHIARRIYVTTYRPAALAMAGALAKMKALEELTGRCGLRASLDRIELTNPVTGDIADYLIWRAPDDVETEPEIQPATGVEQHVQA